MLILGIDPGTRVTGWGLVHEVKGNLSHLDNGGIFTPHKAPFFERICTIHDQLHQIILQFKPQAIALENIFVAKNAASALKLGHARGAAMVAAGREKVPLFEYSANAVKKSLTGFGHASKEQIQKMVKSLLNLREVAFTDASDALAAAICHANSYRMLQKVGT